MTKGRKKGFTIMSPSSMLRFLSSEWQSVNKISDKAKSVYLSIHYYTVKSYLERLEHYNFKNKKIEVFKIGSYKYYRLLKR